MTLRKKPLTLDELEDINIGPIPLGEILTAIYNRFGFTSESDMFSLKRVVAIVGEVLNHKLTLTYPPPELVRNASYTAPTVDKSGHLLPLLLLLKKGRYQRTP